MNRLHSVELIEAEGEIAHHEQFLLLPQGLQKLHTADASKSFCMFERVNIFITELTQSSKYTYSQEVICYGQVGKTNKSINE